jgi:hypothetical protein
MRKSVRLLALAATAVFLCSLASCNYLKKHLEKSETISIDLTQSWTPLYAVEIGGTPYTALCSANPMTVDDLVSGSSYASLWSAVKNNLTAVTVLDIVYATEANQSAGGSVDLYLVGQIPAALPLPGGLSLSQLGIDASQWEIVNADNLSQGDMVASLPIPAAGSNVPEWTDGNFTTNGQSTLDAQFLDYTGSFGFCVHLNMPTHGLTSATPDVKFQASTDVKLTFTP